ncbi:MAG: folate family ECF transporter S component [Clostridia bacterium]|nr:folate family ECF transporter S component [Clostridia bacterium]
MWHMYVTLQIKGGFFLQKLTNTNNQSIFSSEYWKNAISQMNNLQTMSVMALMIAFNIAISSFFIPVGINLRIYFSFIPTAIAGFIGGPILALAYGFACDTIGFIAHPTGPYFPGYLLSSMLGALIYSLFFYRSKITIVKIALCKLTVNVFVNIVLNSLWSSILFDKGYYYFLTKSVIKNLSMLPIEIIILVSLFKVILPIASKMKLIPSNTQNRIPII